MAEEMKSLTAGKTKESKEKKRYLMMEKKNLMMKKRKPLLWKIFEREIVLLGYC